MPNLVSPPLNGANRFAHIDAMRAFAVLLVVLAHAGLGRVVPGGSGVTIFFSISGFIITYLLLRERDKTGTFSARAFYFRRAVKIAPPLVLIVAIPSLVLMGMGMGIVDFETLLSQLLFVFNWTYLSGATNFLDGSDVVWSLAIEEQFYIVFALVWLSIVRVRRWRMVIFAISATGVLYSTATRIVMASDPALGERIYYGSDTRLDGIAWGVLSALGFHWLQHRQALGTRIARIMASDMILVASVCVYILSLVYRDEYFRDTFRYSLQSLAACAVILYGLLPGRGALRAIFYRISQWRIVSLIGLSSYSIYLVHLVVMNTMRSVVDLPGPISVVCLTGLGITAGIFVYKFVEVPVHKWSVQLRLRRAVLA